MNSPAGYTPTSQNTNNKQGQFGGVAGLGIKKLLTEKIGIYAEYNYHDYGTVDFPAFTNFTATYTHSAHVYNQDLVVGLSYYL